MVFWTDRERGHVLKDNNLFALDEEDLVTPLALSERQEWRLLRRLHIPDRFNDDGTGDIRSALVVDVETTGLSTENDDVMQLAMLAFDYEIETGRILTVHKDEVFEGLREPAVPVSDEASLITGITNEMVTGKSIDPDHVAAVVEGADLVIAHNAEFDRPMVERHWECFREKPWGCSLKAVDWLHEGFSAGKLDYLGIQFGWFYDGHEAMADCEACLALLAQMLPGSGKRVMSVVREDASKPEWLVRAIDSPFELKDKLKQRKYQWRPKELANGKVWWTVTDDPEAEIDWLCREIYGRKVDLKAHPITATNRFTERIWDLR